MKNEMTTPAEAASPDRVALKKYLKGELQQLVDEAERMLGDA